MSNRMSYENVFAPSALSAYILRILRGPIFFKMNIQSGDKHIHYVHKTT